MCTESCIECIVRVGIECVLKGCIEYTLKVVLGNVIVSECYW